MPRGRTVLRLEPLGDLGEPGVARDERRATGGRRLGRDHAERLGEDRGHDARVREREQVDEVAVLERAREEHARRVGERLELLAVVAEADDDGARVDPSSASSSTWTPLFSISFPK